MTDMTGIALVAAYALFIAATALPVVRSKGSAAAFFVNRRSSGTWAVALSIIVSCVGASATLGVIGKAFSIGMPAFWWLGSGAVGMSLLALFLARKVRESGAYTMPELVEKHLGKESRPLISLLIVIAWIAILAAQFAALERILHSLTGLDAGYCLALGFGLIVMHSMGGQAVIMRLDRLQSVLLLAGLVTVLAWLWGHNPAWTERFRPEFLNAAFGPRELVYYLFVVGGNYLVCPMLFGRLLSADDAATARRGGLFAAAGLAICSLIIVATGLACIGLLPAETHPDAVFTAIADGLLPGWLRLVLLLTLVSAVVSSADTCLLTASTVLSYDLLRRSDALTCRGAVAGLGLAGLLLSTTDKTILGFLCMAYDVYVSGVVVPVFIGMVAGRKAFVRSGYACCAVICGGALGAVAAISEVGAYSYAGMATAALFTLAGLKAREVSGSTAPAPESNVA